MTDLKNLYDYQTTDVENVLEIRSDTVHPLTSSTRKYIFRLEPTGVLDENSLLLFKLKATRAGTFRVNQFNGVLGAMKRCVFSVGDFVLNDTDEVGKWATLQHLYKRNRATLNAKDSHYLGNQFFSKPARTHNTVIGRGEIVNNPEKSGLAFGGSANASQTTGAVDNEVVRINSLKIGQTASGNHQYAVPLGMIIPALQGRQIPLYMFSEYRIYITVYFHDSDHFVNELQKTDYSAGEDLQAGAGDVVYEDVKLQVDYLIYPAEVQEKQKQMIASDNGYMMDFYDVVRVVKNLPAGSNDSKQSVEFKIGQNDREVHKIYMLRQFTNASGRHRAMMLGGRCEAPNKETINWNINGLDEYPEDLEYPAQHYDELSKALDMDLDVERPMFYTDDNTEWSGLAGKTNPLAGTYKPLGLDLRNGNPGIIGAGRMIGQYPINVKYSRTPHDGSTGTNAKVNDKTGAMDIDFFVMNSRKAVIRAGVKGNDVRVSY